MADPYRITVVCLGNICRSPMGEAVLRQRVQAAGLADRVVVDSAGTGDWHVGHDADHRARATLDAHGYPPLGHAARQIDATWFDELDLVLAMDSNNFAALQQMAARSGADVEIRMMRSFDPEIAHLTAPHDDLDVPDPYFGGDAGFTEVLHMIERAADALVIELPARLKN